MWILSVFSAILLFGYLKVVASEKGAADMVSSTYYQIGKYGWVFSAVLLCVGLMMGICLLDSGKGIECLAFLCCAGLIFVGIAPNFLEEYELRVHKTAAIISAIGGVGWCLSVFPAVTVVLLLVYGLYWFMRDKDSHPFYAAELLGFVDVFATYWIGC